MPPASLNDPVLTTAVIGVAPVAVTLNVYPVPEPAKSESVPLVTVIAPELKSVDTSESSTETEVTLNSERIKEVEPVRVAVGITVSFVPDEVIPVETSTQVDVSTLQLKVIAQSASAVASI